MAREYKPNYPFNVPMKLLVPKTEKVKGSLKKTYSDIDDSALFYGSFRTFGGSEMVVNDVYSVVDTGTIDTWYRPDIKADCRIYIIPTEETYEIIATPENINMQNQFVQIRVKRYGGGA
jgi:hypothetical protein